MTPTSDEEDDDEKEREEMIKRRESFLRKATDNSLSIQFAV
jgi:hypothetical protein